MINYDGKIFVGRYNSGKGDTCSKTTFKYKQTDDIISAKYYGGKIIKGYLIGKVDTKGNIDMKYHHINVDGEVMSGKCTSVPEVMENGKIRLHEKWEWTCSDFAGGKSIIEEL